MLHRKQTMVWAALILVTMGMFFFFSTRLVHGGTYPRIVIGMTSALAVLTIIEAYVNEKKEAAAIKDAAPAQSGGGRAEPPADKEEESTAELAARLLAESEETSEKEPLISAGMVILVAAIFLSLMLWTPVSFLGSSFLFMLVMFLYRKQPVLRSVLIAAGTALVLQLVFGKIFTVPLPAPHWLRMLMY